MADSSKTIKSFVLRQGRLTSGQSKALEELWPKFGRTICEGTFSAEQQFSSKGPVYLEIGFGMGDSLAEQARSNPSANYLGVEVHRPGVGHLLMLIEKYRLRNLCIYFEDSIAVLTEVIPDRSLDVVQIFFPDPWPKKKHHKRRILKQEFTGLLQQKLKSGGIVHVATDWRPYAKEIKHVFALNSKFTKIPAPSRPQTKFESRGVKLGHNIYDLAFKLLC